MDPPGGLKAKARDLLDSVSTGSYKEFAEVSKPGGKTSQILLCRKTEQEKLKWLGLQDKYIANIAVDMRRNGDLAKLKSHGGPFTNVEELKGYIYVKEEIGSQGKDCSSLS